MSGIQRTWPLFLCSNLEPGEKALTAWEQRLLRLISRVYYLPPWCSLDDYRRIFDELKIQGEFCMGEGGRGWAEIEMT